MVTKCYLAVVATLCIGLTALGKEPHTWYVNGKPAADTGNMKSKKGFGAQLWLTEDAKFFDTWQKPAPPTLRVRAEAHRGVPLLTTIIFLDPGVDSRGFANVTYDLIIRKPDGKIYGSFKNLVGWKSKYPALPHTLQLGQGYAGIIIEPHDSAGKYMVEAIVRDKIKRVQLSLQHSFAVK